MLLRSSSTPVLSSLLPSFTESPSNSILSETNHVPKHPPPTCVPQNNHKLSFHQTGSLNLSCNSSPISPSIADLDRHRGFRRAQSEGNLEDLAYASCNRSEDQLHDTDLPKRLSTRPKCLILQTIQSFSFNNFTGLCEEYEEEESDFEDGEEREELEGERTMPVEGVRSMILTEEARVQSRTCSVGFAKQEEMSGNKMHLASGLGIETRGDGIGGYRGGGGGGGGGGDYNSMGSGGDDGDRHGVEEYYKRMVEENPGNPLFMRNYAQFLYQCKRDHEGAEEYYSRAILADPKDGEVLSQYGKLVWELHHDQDRALNYFERAVQASPEDSHVQAAYASFLWDTEEDDSSCEAHQCLPPHFHQGAMISAGA